MAKNPYKDIGDLQAAWLSAWTVSAQQVFQCWRHMFELQQSVLKQTAEHQRDHIEIATGASFLDRYGKRSHDIDPEKDV